MGYGVCLGSVNPRSVEKHAGLGEDEVERVDAPGKILC